MTGAAGFIGMHVAQGLARGDNVIGLDNLSDYYGENLKQARLAQLVGWPAIERLLPMQPGAQQRASSAFHCRPTTSHG